MFDWLYTALGAMMRFFNTITGSYALALLFYALIFKIVFLPFTIKQQKNQIKMAKLTPKMELIKAKYRGRTDQPTMQKQQQEIMELQQKEGYSPLSGCLPLLIQFPIIILLYAVIQNPLTYIAKTTDVYKSYNDNIGSELVETEEINDYFKDHIDGKKEITRTDISLALYKTFSTESDDVKEKVNDEKTLKGKEISLINDINRFVDEGDERFPEYTTSEERIAFVESFGIDFETIPNFMLWGVNLAATPSFKNISILVLIPIIAAAGSWFSMWLTRKLNNTGLNSAQDAQTQASMKMMDLVMPLMTLFIAFNFSGMLGLYWIYQTILGLLTTIILAKLMPLPKYTEDDLQEMRRQQKEAEKAQRAAMKKGVKYRSLHYIDDDDYDTLPAAPGDNSSGKHTSSDKPEIKD